MQITKVEDLGFRDGSTLAFEAEMPRDLGAWNELLGELPVRELFGEAGSGLNIEPRAAGGYSKVRKPGEAELDWWANDNIFHFDGTPWQEKLVFSVIGCVEADPKAPGTELLDTAALLERMEADGFWEQRGFSAQDIREMKSVFTASAYFSEALPYLRSQVGEADKHTIDERLKAVQAKAGSATIQEYIAKLDIEAPAKIFDLVTKTPIKGLDAVFFDGGGRNPRLIGPDGSDLTQVLHAARETYLAGDRPRELGLTRTIGWTANKAVIYPRLLHRALPGNDYKRFLQVGFLVEADGVAA